MQPLRDLRREQIAALNFLFPSGLHVTQVRIRRLNIADGRVKAVAKIVLSNSLAIHGVKVIMGSNGLFVEMPSRRQSDGTFQDIARPTKQAVREGMEEAVLAAYFACIDLGVVDDDPGTAGVGARLKPRPPTLTGWIARDPSAT
jgi:stage V sporulation protein G